MSLKVSRFVVICPLECGTILISMWIHDICSQYTDSFQGDGVRDRRRRKRYWGKEQEERKEENKQGAEVEKERRNSVIFLTKPQEGLSDLLI